MNSSSLNTIVRVLLTVIAIILCLFQLKILWHYVFELQNWQNIGSFLFYLMIVYFFIFRFPAKTESTSFKHWFFALSGTFMPLFMQVDPLHAPSPELQPFGIAFTAVGIVFSLFALLNLGRGFGVIAAVRKIQTNGPYRWVRHPLYLGEIIWFIGNLLMSTNVNYPEVYGMNLLVLATFVGAQSMRILEEEALLTQHENYQLYKESV
ncbi:MAG: DUF1295 domain-containing protein, partial [Cyanobacteria bacterium]|nr:DUF1295 domain-containing protein [Cyanobacteriota bacterium]